jgi:hypothetical protein
MQVGELEVKLKEKEQKALSLEHELQLNKIKIQQLNSANQYHTTQFFNTLLEAPSATAIMRLKEEKEELQYQVYQYQDDLDKLKKEKNTLSDSMRRLQISHFAETQGYEPLDLTEQDLHIPAPAPISKPPMISVVRANNKASTPRVQRESREAPEPQVQLAIGPFSMQRKESGSSLAAKANSIQKMNPIERRKYLNSQLRIKS